MARQSPPNGLNGPVLHGGNGPPKSRNRTKPLRCCTTNLAEAYCGSSSSSFFLNYCNVNSLTISDNCLLFLYGRAIADWGRFIAFWAMEWNEKRRNFFCEKMQRNIINCNCYSHFVTSFGFVLEWMLLVPNLAEMKGKVGNVLAINLDLYHTITNQPR